jgi:hypothetical protein
MQQAVVERFEDGQVVLWLPEGDQYVTVARSALSTSVHEGDYLQVELEGDQLIHVEHDPDATEAARQRIADKMARLRRGEHLRKSPDDQG